MGSACWHQWLIWCTGYSIPPYFNTCLTPSRAARKWCFRASWSSQVARLAGILDHLTFTCETWDPPWCTIQETSTWTGKRYYIESEGKEVLTSLENPIAAFTSLENLVAALSRDTWMTGWIEELGGSWSRYATEATLANTLKGPKYLKWAYD
jgi:hypothetical protein